MKLIDVLLMISKGELKEGTKIKLLYDDTIYELYCDDLIREGDNMPIFGLYSFEVLREEVELIEPECIPNVGKTSEPTDNTKIEELDVKSLSNIFIANDDFNKMVAFSTTLHKLNEVIRYINRRAENE